MSSALHVVKDTEEVEGETELCCRFLEPDEYYKLESIFLENDDEVPNPKISRIYIIEVVETQEIIAFVDIVLVPMVTMWIEPSHRHSGLWVKLIEGIYPISERNKRTYVVCTKDETIEMCKRLGLRLLDHPVFVKDSI